MLPIISLPDICCFLSVITVVCFVRKKIKKKKSRAWVDNLTLSYIADSNIDLTKVAFLFRIIYPDYSCVQFSVGHIFCPLYTVPVV